jgi:hypothetical protein
VLTEAPPPVDDERGTPWATGPGVAGLGRPDVRVPAPRSDAGPAAAGSYGDWTKPSRSSGLDEGRPAAGPLLVAPAPGTTAIPERRLGQGADEAFDDDYDGEYDGDLDGAGPYSAEQPYPARGFRDERFDAPRHDEGFGDEPFDDERFEGQPFDSAELPAAEPLTGPGSAVGGRAAKREQRQAAEAARRKAAKARHDKARDTGMADVGGEHPRRPRRVALSLLAMALVALAVLGVYSFATPDTKEAGSQNQATSSTPAESSAPDTAALAPQPTQPPPVEAAPTTPVRVPVTVLNATSIDGLAGKISAAVVAGGWESPGVGAYTGDPVAATTVFFTEGDEQQRQAAVQLVDQFPTQLHGPAPRFFDIPDVADPGLVVVATGDWQP